VLGEKVENATEHPILRPSLNALAKTYEMAHDPRYTELFVRQGLDGERVNCFTSLHHSTQDLLDKVKALRILGPGNGHLLSALRGMGRSQCAGEHHF